MFLKENNTPGTKPIGNNEQEIRQSSIKIGDSRDSDQHVDQSSKQRPYSTTDTLEGPAQHLHGESEAIGIGNIVGHNTQRQQNQQEASKAPDRKSTRLNSSH